MRDVYYRVTGLAEVPEAGALVRIWWADHVPTADVSTWSDEGRAGPDDPDLTLFRASLARAQLDLLGVFVWLEDDALWRDEWGDLVQ